MKVDHKYITERFLEAFDAVQAETGANIEIMESALSRRSNTKVCVAIRMAIACRMAQRNEGQPRIRRRDIALAIGVTSWHVDQYLLRSRKMEAA